MSQLAGAESPYEERRKQTRWQPAELRQEYVSYYQVQVCRQRKPSESGPEVTCTLDMGTVTSKTPGYPGTHGDKAKPFDPPG